ncbi:MarR family transcriptional regulator [Roseomonas frigidaquae]|uniref:MarR family transcriptional regulator n=1 Tax=Falsiroseomonas frigidaquae TaxID=487318 RepID=A0ABX1ETH0_9PROT|nr:MarR family transcriptional regulator [Falsiroseomonas frigidaquae]NKE43921.1 MarR family transcriptional regulator [Falsiroseomonas frigidaquae]
MSPTPPPSDLHDHLGYWLRMVSNAVSQDFAREIEGQGVTVAEWVFLRALHDADCLAPSLLAERMGMTKGAISKLADRLSEKKLVQRAPNPEDGRGQMLSLTPAGRALVPELARIADGNDAAFFDTLAPAERDHLGALLRKIARAHELTRAPVD